jgi:DNA/RNA-binding domain of Phe-tRNA-synthetase-like protein
MRVVHIDVAPELRPILHLGVLTFTGLSNGQHESRLNQPLMEAAAAVRARPPAERESVRAMYRRTGLDPTRHRPSSEALLRRVRRGDPLPRINTLVDVCNWCSLEFQLPYGLYDLSRVEGAVTLRLGNEGESYPGIRKDEVHVGDRITLADSQGPFGNPSSDSARTMVTNETTSALVVVFAPIDVSDAHLHHVLSVSSTRARAYCGGTEQSAAVV